MLDRVGPYLRLTPVVLLVLVAWLRPRAPVEDALYLDWEKARREALSRDVAEGRKTLVRVASRDGQPFRGLMVVLEKERLRLDGNSGLWGSPSVFDFPLSATDVEVAAFAGECRPGRIRAGRIPPGGAPVLLTLEPAWRIRARLLGEDGSPLANQEVRLVVTGRADEFPGGDGGAPPAEVACLFRDHGGQEHLQDFLTDAAGASVWAVTWWRTDSSGRLDAFTPVFPRGLSVVVRRKGEGWLEADGGSFVIGPVLDLGDKGFPAQVPGAPFRLLYEDGSPVGSQKVIAQPARFPAGLRVEWTEVVTNAEGTVGVNTLSPDESYRFIVAPLPSVESGGWRWSGDQGVGVPSADAVIVLKRQRPMLSTWTGWQEAPPPKPK